MGAREFGRLVEQAMATKGLSQAQVAVRVGVLSDGRVLNDKQVSRIREGSRRLNTELVGRLIEVLDLDPMPTWEVAGLWPPGVSADDLSETLATRGTAAGRVASHREGARSAAPQFGTDQGIQAKRTWRELAGQRVPPKVAA